MVTVYQAIPFGSRRHSTLFDVVAAVTSCLWSGSGDEDFLAVPIEVFRCGCLSALGKQ